MTHRVRAGFTLLELLISIALIGIMAAMLLPSLARAREAARRASCAANLSGIGMALHMYAEESDRQFPWSGGNNNGECLVYFAPRYGIMAESFICPSDQDNDLRNIDSKQIPIIDATLGRGYSLRASYDYFGAYTTAPLTLPPVEAVGFPKIPLVWDIGSYVAADFNHVPGGSNVLWMDGSVTWVKRDLFAAKNFPYAPKNIEYVTPQPPPPSDEWGEIKTVKKVERENGPWSTAIPVPPPPPQDPPTAQELRLRKLFGGRQSN